MIERQVTIFKLHNRGDMLPPGDVHQIRRVLSQGGLCVLPSDTCYALAGNPLRKGVASLVDAVLERQQQKISLAFASQVMVERYVDLGTPEYRILDAAHRNTPLTLIAPVSASMDPTMRNALPASLFTKNELGVRLPHSWVERQVSAEMDGPITTAAIYYSDGSRVIDCDDAILIVLGGLMKLRREDVPVIAISHPTIHSNDVSSVVGFSRDSTGKKAMIVFREGAVERKRIIEIAGHLTARDVEEWT
jgi:tRNA A37 threonylcarbamoyladenosine synthetase subunit TsaC/SUA5/YrdC